MMNRSNSYFDGQFQNYDNKKGNGWGMNWRAYMILRCDEIFSRLKEELQKRNSSGILEIGCATGDFTKRYLPYAKEKKVNILGIDISERAVEICRDIFVDEKCCSFEMGRLPELDERKKYDIILCMDVMEYFDIKERDECYKNICSCMNGEGCMLLQAPLSGEDVNQFVEQISKYFSVREIDYVYGQLWYEVAEVWLYKAVEALYFKNRTWPLYIIGLGAYKMMSSRSVVSFFFWLNRLLLPNKKSHIVLVCRHRKENNE